MWNNTGLASVTQGTTTITGIGTDWIYEREGWWLWLRGEPRPHEIDRIISATELETVSPIEMATSGSVEYAIIPMHGLNQRLVEEVQAAAVLFKNARDAWDLVFSSFSGTTYQLWLDQGNTGSVAEFLVTLQGDKGDKGDDGDSAYQIWLDAGNTGTVQDFLDDLTAGAVGAAAASAAAASTSETNAGLSAGAASNDAAQVAADRAMVESLYDSFDDRFLGPKAADPTTDNDGDPLVAGANYWNTTADEERVFNGTVWVSPSASATASAQAALQSETNAATSEGNAATSEANAAAHATAASLASNAEEWVSGAAILRGNIYWSPGDGFPYRAMADIPNSTVDPKDEIAANFVPVYPPAIGDMAKAVYDSNDNGAVDLAEQVPWLGVTDKPSVFPPAGHAHGISAITGLQAALDDKADQTALFSGSYNDLTDRPAAFPPAAHQHAIAQITGLQDALDGAGGGRHEHIRTDDLTNGLTIYDTTLTGFSGFLLDLELVTLSAITDLNLRLSNDGGTTFQTSGYRWTNEQISMGSNNVPTTAGSNASLIEVTRTNTSTPLFGFVALADVANAQARGRLRSEIGNTSFVHRLTACMLSDFAPDALRIWPTTGTFTSGKVHLYGLREGV